MGKIKDNKGRMMQKIVCNGLILSMLLAISAAFGDTVPSNMALTTKGYVDAGLRYVHGEIVNVNDTVNSQSQAITSLQNQITGLQSNAEGLIAGTGINIDASNRINIAGLPASGDTVYVLQGGQAVPLVTAGYAEWNDSELNLGNGE